jgi:hypothetical protein
VSRKGQEGEKMLLLQLHQIKDAKDALLFIGFNAEEAAGILNSIRPENQSHYFAKLKSLLDRRDLSPEAMKDAASSLKYFDVGVDLAVKMTVDNLQKSSTKMQVFIHGNKNPELLSVDEITRLAAQDLAKDFKDKTALDVLRTAYPEAKTDAELYNLLHSRNNWLTMDDFKNLGNQDFNSLTKLLHLIKSDVLTDLVTNYARRGLYENF